MNLRDKIKELATQRKISVAELERVLGFGNGSISKWNKQSPSTEKLKKVADYFDVSLDYLVGRNVKNEIDSNAYFRMDSDNLTDDEIKELKKQLKFAEAIALKNIRDKE